MIQINCYPGGVKRVVTFSYDDGHPNDERLVALFNKYHVKGTFHLNSSRFKGCTDEELAAIRQRYIGHEISCHSVHHGEFTHMTDISIVKETIEDRLFLEKLAGYPVVGMSYPNGGYNAHVMDVLRSCGIVYNRTAKGSLRNMDAPLDFLEWIPSCHHRDAETVGKAFLDTIDSEWYRPILYIWGHSHELRTEEDWQYIEHIVSMLANNPKVWYATNIEIYNYTMAARSLVISADESMIYNPSSINVWVERNKKEIFEIPAGQTVTLPPCEE